MPISTIGQSGLNAPLSLTSPTFSGTPTGVGVLTSGTAVASTSGTSIDFTGIPSWVKRITCIFNVVSTNGTTSPIIQVGTSGGVVTTGYGNMAGVVTTTNNTTRGTAYTNGFAVTWSGGSSSYNYTGTIVLTPLGASNTWIATGVLNNNNQEVSITAGTVTLGGTLDRVRFTNQNGTDAFDAGTVNILYE